MESIILEYISNELVNKPEILPLHTDTPLLESGILDSLYLLRLVLFLEEQFGVDVAQEDLVPEHFRNVEDICTYLRSQQQEQRVKE